MSTLNSTVYNECEPYLCRKGKLIAHSLVNLRGVFATFFPKLTLEKYSTHKHSTSNM